MVRFGIFIRYVVGLIGYVGRFDVGCGGKRWFVFNFLIFWFWVWLRGIGEFCGCSRFRIKSKSFVLVTRSLRCLFDI